MNNTPKVSVIIPVYNVEAYLRECLDSIINQTLRDIEIICVDDGSTDGSPAILREYSAKDERIQVITQENKGLSGARNTGLDRASGKFIYFIDSDDMLKLQALHELLEIAEREEADVVFFDSEVLFDGKESQVSHRAENYYIRKHNYASVTTGINLFAAMMEKDEYRCSACMQIISTKHLKTHSIRFYEGIVHEDEMFTFLCMMKADKAVHINKPYYIRRMREGSITGNNGFRNFYGYMVSCMYIECFEQNEKLYDDVKLQINRKLDEMKNAVMAIYSSAEDAHLWLDQLNTEEREWAEGVLRLKPIIPKVIHYCWFGGNPKSDKVLRCMQSWREYLPDYEIIEWNESNCDIAGSKFASSMYKAKKWAFVADYFRFKVLYEHGGIYMDTDILLHKPLDDFLKYNAFFSMESFEWVSGGVIGAAAKCEVIQRILNCYTDIEYIAGEDISNITVCRIITKVLIDDYAYQLTGNTQFLSDNIAVYSPNVMIINIDDGQNYCEHLYTANVSWHDDINKFPEGMTHKNRVLERYYYNIFVRPSQESSNIPAAVSLEHDTRALIDRYGAKRVIIWIIKERLYPRCPKWVLWLYRKVRGR